MFPVRSPATTASVHLFGQLWAWWEEGAAVLLPRTAQIRQDLAAPSLHVSSQRWPGSGGGNPPFVPSWSHCLKRLSENISQF